MTAHRVFYDLDSLVVVAIHPLEQPVEASAYETDKRAIGVLVADGADVPSVMEDVREPVLDEAGNAVVGADGRPVLGRIVEQRPRRLTAEFIENNVAPVQETIDSTKGKLALLEADKLEAFTAAIDALNDGKEKTAAQLKFNAPTWSRSDPLWNKLGKAVKMTPKVIDDQVWRAAAA